MIKIENIPDLWPEEERFLFYIPDQMIPICPKCYGRRIRELRTRKDRGYSREILAQEVGITQQALAKIEDGKNKTIRREYTPIFAKKLSCTTAYLLGCTDKIDGTWYKPEDGLLIPEAYYVQAVMPYRADEKISIDGSIRGYNRDPDLWLLCMSIMAEESPEKRGTYKRQLRELLKNESS